MVDADEVRRRGLRIYLISKGGGKAELQKGGVRRSRAGRGWHRVGGSGHLGPGEAI